MRIPDGRPWSEERYFALGETAARIELLDGALLVSPRGDPRRQRVVDRIARGLESDRRVAGLFVHRAVNVRLRPGRIVIPDLTVTERIDFDEPVIDAATVRLAVEVVPPSNSSLKARLYREAGIPLCLLTTPGH